MQKLFLALAFFLASITPAAAVDKDLCPPDLICASQPETIVKALRDAGYQAKLGKDKQNDPMITSAAAGYSFDILFYGCELAVRCDSLQFYVSFSDDGGNTLELANKWNKTNRFSQAAISDKKSFIFNYDVSTVGGLNAKNFADVIDWWADRLGELNSFFKQNPAPKK